MANLRALYPLLTESDSVDPVQSILLHPMDKASPHPAFMMLHRFRIQG